MKKVVCFVLCLILACGSIFAIAACDKKDPIEPIKIVYLGDSIAEGLAGPSPLTERENYAYYALLGRCNEYVYYNRSVSGHRTGDLLELIRREDADAYMTITHIKEADIIHISILGNDILRSGFQQMLIEAADDRYDKIETILPRSRKNIANIVDRLKELNPDAVIVFQTVYNPADPDSALMNSDPKALQTLAGMGIHEDGYRALAGKVVSRLNSVLWDYLEEHPGAFYISDVYKVFDEVYTNSREEGFRLIANDGVHPSNEGHALAALVNQELFESLGLAIARDKFVSNYKKIRMDQIERLFADSVDYKSVRKQIKKAKTYEEVSELYFGAIRGKMPKYI